MAVDDGRGSGFEVFVAEVEPRLRRALTGALGADWGRDATAEALAYGWEHWSRVEQTNNPAGYLYRVGLRWGRRQAGRRPLSLPRVSSGRLPEIDPALPEALLNLTERQRACVYLVHGHAYSLAEVAEILGVSKSSVQKHVDRGLSRLRRSLGVDDDH